MKTIVDFIIRLKNAYLAKKEEIFFPHSRLISEILKILKREKFIKEFETIEEKKKKLFKIYLNYLKNTPVFTEVKIFSKPGRRIYVKVSSLKPVLGGRGVAILSTPKGIITDKEAKKLKVGGELWFHIW